MVSPKSKQIRWDFGGMTITQKDTDKLLTQWSIIWQGNSY